MARTRKPDPLGGDRDLRFRPADPAAATTLDSDQIEHYNQHGFVRGLTAFDPAEADDLRCYVDGLLQTVLDADDRRNAYSINCYHLVCERLYDLVRHPPIVDAVADIIGGDIVCWGSHLFAKLPRDPRAVPLHQDAVYWPWTPSRTVTAWLAITDADAGNAAMQFSPGSHLLGELPHDVLGLDGTRVLGRQVSAPERYADPVFDELAAGTFSLHSDLLLHGSEPNRSDRPRIGLTLRYAAANVRAIDGYDDWRKNAIIVRGSDPDGFWYDRRRPVGDRPELMADLWGEFDGQPLDAS